MADTYFLTIAICTRNRAAMLSDALTSVLPQLQPDCALLVVDNASSDGTADLVKKLAAENLHVSYVREEQLGISHARATALREANSTWILFFDDDEFAGDGWLDAYLKFTRDLPSPRVGAVGSSYVPLYEKKPPTWLDSGYNTLDFGDKAFAFTDKGGPWCGNVAYLRAAALEVGGFNLNLGRKDAFRGAHEESFLNSQLRDAGWEVWWLPGAPIQHRIPPARTTFRAFCKLAYDGGRSSALVKLANRPENKQRKFVRQRLCVLPFQVMAHLIAALILCLVWKQARAARQFFAALHALGFNMQARLEVKNGAD